MDKKIDVSLSDSAKALQVLKNLRKNQLATLPRSALKMEERLQTLQDELDSISDKMLAYKLRRLADSKMLEEVATIVKEVEHANREVQGSAVEAVAETVAKATDSNTASQKEGTSAVVISKDKYHSNTFKCKSDLDQCLLESHSAIERALCYALFIRCAIKG